MIYILWNCQGLGSDLTVRALREMIRKYRPTVVFLMETKSRNNRMERVRRSCNYQHGFCIPPIGTAGGLCLWWDTNINLEILSFSQNFIDTKVSDMTTGTQGRATWVYGTPYREEKEIFWNILELELQPMNLPWFCGGDFNEILWSFEKSGGQLYPPNRPRYLRDFMEKVALVDLGYNGSRFTWRARRQNDQFIQERLDRGLVNCLWQEEWPNTTVTHYPAIGSDHNPIIVETDHYFSRGNRAFKFEAFWVEDRETRQVIDHGWSTNANGQWIDKWQTKLQKCTELLTQWSRGKYTNNRKRVAVLQAELQDKQGRWEENYEEIKRITSNLNEAWAREETYWHQRSRVKWLNEGDRNTTYFHHSTIARRRQNRILRIQGNNGQWYSGQNATRRVIEEHFKDLFATECVEDDLDILSCVDHVVTEDINTALLQEISSQEIKDAAMQMGSLKAPGPDGYHGIFYQQYWDIIHREVQGIVKDFFAESCNPTTLNSTNIVLIPKVPNPESVTQYRPISLCNYSYKIISKVMANRLKQFIPEIISPAQNAFVPNRQIQDNILLAHEAFHLLKLRKSTKLYKLGMKLDMNKAYDRVEWNFLEAMMRKLGFADKWVRLIMSLVKSVELALVINGKPGSYFKPTRGIRQGDPLSPYLFLFVSEALSSLINKACDAQLLQGLSFCRNGPILSHLLFADDTLLFLKANAQNCRNMMNLLNGYCRASGQQINLGKSSVFFSPNTPEDLQRELGTILGMSIVTDPGKYLGLPTLWGRSKSEALNFVKERLLRKIGGWKQGLLSQAGRDILIKSVAQAVPTYPM